MTNCNNILFVSVAYVNLGNSLIAAGRIEEAEMVLRAGATPQGRVRDRRTHESARVSSLIQLASLYSQNGKLVHSLSAYKAALMLLPENQVVTVGWTRQVIYVIILTD